MPDKQTQEVLGESRKFNSELKTFLRMGSDTKTKLEPAIAEIERLARDNDALRAAKPGYDRKALEAEFHKWHNNLNNTCTQTELCQETWNAALDAVDAALPKGAGDATLRAEIERLSRELRIAEAKNRASLANNLCPDHRDKQVGKPCLACTNEKLQRDLEAANNKANDYYQSHQKLVEDYHAARRDLEAAVKSNAELLAAGAERVRERDAARQQLNALREQVDEATTACQHVLDVIECLDPKGNPEVQYRLGWPTLNKLRAVVGLPLLRDDTTLTVTDAHRELALDIGTALYGDKFVTNDNMIDNAAKLILEREQRIRAEVAGKGNDK